MISFPRSPVERALMWSSASSSLAKGVMFGVSALYFTTVIGLSPATVGAGLTAAGVAGMLASFGAGQLSDRYGARRILLVAMLAQGAAIGAYCLARTAVAFVLIACLASAAQGAQRTAQVTLLAREFTGDDRIDVRARLRVVTNAFVGAGSASVAIALAVGTAAAYTTAMTLAVPRRRGRHLPGRPDGRLDPAAALTHAPVLPKRKGPAEAGPFSVTSDQ